MQIGLFEWDDGKAKLNLVKHQVSFENARRVFDDPSAMELEDEVSGATEQRFATIGMVDERCLFVAYTMRGETIRIISARGATGAERRRYHDGT